MATITSAGTGNSDATATWVGGVVPDADDDVVIDSGHTVTQNANATFNSLAVNGTFVASSSYSLTIDGERSNGRALDIVGTFTHGNGTITITTAADTDLRWPSSSEAYNITINNASCIARPTGDKPVIANNLTIAAGEYNTLDSGGSTSHALTVAGVVTNNGTLTLNGSTVNLGSTSAEAGDFQGSGTFNLDTSTINFHTAGSANFTPSTSANFDTNTSTLNLIGLNSSNRAHNFTFASGNLHNITTSRGAGTDTHTDTLNGNCTITGNLTVGANSNFSTGTRVFTVNGHVEVTGQLICNGSDKPMTFKSIEIESTGTYDATSGTTTLTGEHTSGFVWYNLGTFNDTDGTVTIGDGSTSIGTTHIRENRFHHLTINRDASSTNTVWRDVSGDTLTIDGDLTITKGFFYRHVVTDTLTVTGDVTVEANGNLGLTADTGANNFGSLTINSGGTYNATSGTTTITNKNSSNYMFDNNGTFTHNNGTVHFKADTSSGTWYAMDGASSATETEFYNISTERVRASGTEQYRFWVGGAGKHLTVLNNIDIGENTNVFSSNGSGNFKLLGNCYIRGTTGGLNLDNVTTVNMGTVTIESGGTLEFADGNSINVEGIRNIGGTVQAT